MIKVNIAIDGPAGSGKTTIGRLLAEKLNYQFLDSGLLYRHFAWFCQKNNFSQLEKEGVSKILSLWQKILLDNKPGLIANLEKERDILGSSEISNLASQFSPLPELRKITLDYQRELTKNKGWIVVGRDITSEVLPQAEVKIFLTASLAERVKRRYRQYQTKVGLQEVEKELQARDKKDQERKVSPLKKTADSWELDTTHLSPAESAIKILIYIHGKKLVNF